MHDEHDAPGRRCAVDDIELRGIVSARGRQAVEDCLPSARRIPDESTRAGDLRSHVGFARLVGFSVALMSRTRTDAAQMLRRRRDGVAFAFFVSRDSFGSRTP
jgi:hypothetical protein